MIWSRGSQNTYLGNYATGFLPTTGKAEICIRAEKDESGKARDEATVLVGVTLDQSPPHISKMYLFSTYYGMFVGGAGKEVRLSPVRNFGSGIKLVYDADAFTVQLFVNGENASEPLALNSGVFGNYKNKFRFFVATSEHQSALLVSNERVCHFYK